MRNNYDPGIKTKNRLNGESIKMGIHAQALQKVMDILTNLYSDPTAAVIREYSTNARDSHIAAGKGDVPIKVTLPTNFAPVFIVQDFGVGMSVDDIRETYSQYGASTKEDNDDETGYLGMGSKSGLTYTDQFTVTAVKGGVKTSAVVARSDDGTASIRVLDTSSTTEGNGVTIQMPVKDQGNFIRKAESFFRWWAPGTVDLVNGNHRPIEGRQITDDITIIEGMQNYVVMGGVGYPVNQYEVNLSQILPYNEAVVCYVPMGSVNFTPSREELHYTKLTRDTLNEYAARVKANVIKAANAEIAAAGNHTEALLVARKWRQTLPNHPWSYKGTTLPAVNYGGLKVDDPAMKYAPSAYGKKKASDCEYLDISDLRKYVFVTDWTGKSLPTSIRAKVEQWAEKQNLDGKTFVFCEKQPQLPWTDGCTAVDYETVKAEVLPKTAKGSYAPSPWDVHRVGKGTVSETDIQDKNLVYLSPAWLGDAPRRGGRLAMEHLAEALPGATFIIAGANRWDRLNREYPKAVELTAAIKAEVTKRIKAMSEEAKAGVADEYVFNTFARLDGNAHAINDDDVKAVVLSAPRVRKAAEPYKEYLRNVQHVQRILRYYDVSFDTAKVESDLVTKAHEALDTYPFIRYTNEAGVTHTIEYINALHKENN